MGTENFGLVIHGGAGTMARDKMTNEMECAHRDGLQRALDAGYRILQDGGTALDATEAAVRVLEDDPLFNAGKGSVFTSAGTHELDAAIMDGKTLRAGAVANLQHVRNPIALARMVMEKSPHVMFVGEGAERFAKEVGAEFVDAEYFHTEERWQALQRVQAAEKATAVSGKGIIPDQDRHGTVGAVALIERAIWRRRLPPAEIQTRNLDASAIPPSLARELMRTIERARCPRRGTANILFVPLPVTKYPR